MALSLVALVSVTCFMTTAQIADVMGFGGTLDVTAALNTAFAKTQQRIQLPAGIYRVDGTLTPPTCASIEGDGQENTTLLAPATDGTFLRINGGGPTELRDFRVDGTRSTGMTGMRFGDATGDPNARWHGWASNLRVENFTGTGAIGVRVADTIKSRFDYVRIASNQTNLVCRNFAAGGYPTTTVFRDSECVNAVENGAVLNNGESLVFDHVLFEGNGERGVLVDTLGVKSVNNAHFINGCWFEDNWHGTDPGSNYAMEVVASGGTARVSLRDAFFHANNSGKALRFTGPGVSAFRCDNVQCPNVAAMIRVDDQAWGAFDLWPGNLDQNVVVQNG